MIDGRSPIAFDRDDKVVIRLIIDGDLVECELDPLKAGWLGIDMLEAAHRVHSAQPTEPSK